METLSALLAICAENSPVPGEFPAQRPVTRSFNAFFDLRLNKRLSKQSWGWWFETLSHPLWRHRNAGKGSNRLIANSQPKPIATRGKRSRRNLARPHRQSWTILYPGRNNYITQHMWALYFIITIYRANMVQVADTAAGLLVSLVRHMSMQN